MEFSNMLNPSSRHSINKFQNKPRAKRGVFSSLTLIDKLQYIASGQADRVQPRAVLASVIEPTPPIEGKTRGTRKVHGCPINITACVIHHGSNRTMYWPQRWSQESSDDGCSISTFHLCFNIMANDAGSSGTYRTFDCEGGAIIRHDSTICAGCAGWCAPYFNVTCISIISPNTGESRVGVINNLFGNINEGL